MESEKETLQSGVRPKDSKNWGTGHCALWFGDDDSAEYDMVKMKKFFKRKFGKRKDANKNL